ncbi:hypothetical protein RIF29_47038 [Crotalaria pallida]|uniref:Uncharacterized protein n=1 Tax=Crotalaria pallida TaxID=3830 RepID=A0AAN9DTQ7_CROPI
MIRMMPELELVESLLVTDVCAFSALKSAYGLYLERPSLNPFLPDSLDLASRKNLRSLEGVKKIGGRIAMILPRGIGKEFSEQAIALENEEGKKPQLDDSKPGLTSGKRALPIHVQV